MTDNGQGGDEFRPPVNPTGYEHVASVFATFKELKFGKTGRPVLAFELEWGQGEAAYPISRFPDMVLVVTVHMPEFPDDGYREMTDEELAGPLPGQEK